MLQALELIKFLIIKEKWNVRLFVAFTGERERRGREVACVRERMGGGGGGGHG